MNDQRADQIDQVVDLFEKKYAATIRNAEAWRHATLQKVSAWDDERIAQTLGELQGAGTVKGASKGGVPKDYAYSRLDHAITDAAMMLGRIEASTGQRCHTDRDIQVVLTDSYGAELAGKAFALALDDCYAVAMPRYAMPPTPIDQELVAYGEYLRRGGTPPQADPRTIGT
jgi:hypothetical protein